MKIEKQLEEISTTRSKIKIYSRNKPASKIKVQMKKSKTRSQKSKNPYTLN